MYSFGNIIYLNVEKTGSSFVRFFLDNNLVASTGQFSPLKQPNEPLRPDHTYITTVRDPLAQYVSLFRFGVAGAGSLYNNLKPYRLSKLYETASVANFEKWLAFVLNPRVAKYTGDGFGKSRPKLFGMMTFRYLNMVIQNPEHHLGKRQNRDGMQRVYEANRYPATVLRNENLNDDLFAFSQSEQVRSYFKPAADVRKWLDTVPKVNTSQASTAFDYSRMSAELKARVKEREWFLYQNFYPQNS